MKRLLSLLILTGVVFWSCEDEPQSQPEDCAGIVGGDNICGCTDSTSINYDSTATFDDGSCKDCAGVTDGDNICGCTDITAINYDSLATFDDGSCVNTIEIIYNIHDSLPVEWITEFYVIMNNLLNIIPAYQYYFNSLTVYAWNDNIDDPYPGIQGGSYVGGGNGLPIMVLEIPNSEFTYDSMHRYSVIAHEYFHVYNSLFSDDIPNPLASSSGT